MSAIDTLAAIMARVDERYDSLPSGDAVTFGLLRGVVTTWAAELNQLRGAIAAQEERMQAAGAKCGVPYESVGCDWPDWVAERLLEEREKVRVAREALEYSQCSCKAPSYDGRPLYVTSRKSPPHEERLICRRCAALAALEPEGE